MKQEKRLASSLWVNWWGINQVASKYQMNFLGQNLQKKMSKTEKVNFTSAEFAQER